MIKQKLKNKWLAGLAAVAICGAGTAWDAGAVSINGSMSFGSLAPFSHNGTGDLSDASEITLPQMTVVQAFEDFSGLAGSLVAGTPTIGFDPDPFSVTSNPIWSVGGFTFDLETVSVDVRSASQLNLSGNGTLKKAGFDDTAGAWTFTGNQSGLALSFSAGTATVPDGGTTLVLLGFAMTGLVLVRRKLGLCHA